MSSGNAGPLIDADNRDSSPAPITGAPIAGHSVAGHAGARLLPKLTSH